MRGGGHVVPLGYHLNEDVDRERKPQQEVLANIMLASTFVWRVQGVSFHVVEVVLVTKAKVVDYVVTIP